MKQENCEKVNIIAHSKGGLEARYLAGPLGQGGKNASITTVSTPHHGSKTVSKLYRLPRVLFRIAAFFVNLWCRLLGDAKPDFYEACYELTQEHMQTFNTEVPDAKGVYYQSFATALKRPTSDMLMWLPALVVGTIEGENDSLVTTQSAQWSNFKGVWRGATARGISHLDSVDFRRRPLTRKQENGKISDIAEAYLQIVRELKKQGY